MVYPALLPLMRIPRLPLVDWNDVPADLNRFVRFAERRNLVFARVPSHFKSSLYLVLLTLCARWGWIINATPRPLYCTGRELLPILKEAECLQGRSGRRWKIPTPKRVESWTVKSVEDLKRRTLINGRFSRIGRWGEYRDADKSLGRPDRKNNWKVAIFRPTRSLLPRRPGWTDNQLSELFLSGLQKLEFGRSSLFPSWSG